MFAPVDKAADFHDLVNSGETTKLAFAHDLDFERDAESIVQARRQGRREIGFRDRRARRFDHDCHFFTARSRRLVDDADILAVGLAKLGDARADRLGKDVHAADFHHVVGAAEQLRKTPVDGSARAVA